MTEASDSLGYGFLFGYVDSDGESFGLGSGPRTVSLNESVNVPGNLTQHDTGILGSGTKGYISTAVMKLVEQGKISLDDPAHQHIDIVLMNAYNTTMYELFGLWANDVTVRHLIFMKSGI